jgi:pachytene checkpoint protein 2
VHRSTDALLAGIDRVARSCPNVTFVATTNHVEGVDEAFLSRADLVQAFGYPGLEAVVAILLDTIAEVGPAEAFDEFALTELATECVAASVDARQVRKLVLRAICSRRELALDPRRLRPDDLRAALREEQSTGEIPVAAE